MIWIISIFVCCTPWMASGEELRIVDRFSLETKTDPRGIPAGWTLEGKRGEESRIMLQREEEIFFLSLRSRNDAFGLKRDLFFTLRQTPILNWRWRAAIHPFGGDIRRHSTDDQAGQIYVIFPRFPSSFNSRAVGYIWDPLAPIRSEGTSPSFANMKYIVLQSGDGKLRQWITEKRNVYEDFRRLFGEEPPPAKAVLIFINSQLTRSSAECDYREIFFSAE